MAFEVGTLSSAKTTYSKDGKRVVKYSFTDATELGTSRKDLGPAFDLRGAESIHVQFDIDDNSSGQGIDANLLVSLDGTNFTSAAAGNLILDDSGVDEVQVWATTSSTIQNYNGGYGKISAVGNTSGSQDVQVTVTAVFPHRSTGRNVG